jgi:hypothetical protein
MKRFLAADVSSALHGAPPERSSPDHQAVVALLEQVAVAFDQALRPLPGNPFIWHYLAYTRLIADEFGIGGTG